MYTEAEIMNQHYSLVKTYAVFQDEKSDIKLFLNKYPNRKIVFIASGSSNMIANSGAQLFSLKPESCGLNISAGDYILNPDMYRDLISNSIILILTRSGMTTEIIEAARHIKNNFGSPILSVILNEGSDLEEFSDYTIKMPWAYDKSVCQTCSVTNLYLATLLLYAYYFDDLKLLESAGNAVRSNEEFKMKYRESLENIAGMEWSNAIILADNVLGGIADEGSLVFTEISMIPAQQFNLLDYRHGPIILCDHNTLVIAVTRRGNIQLQAKMLSDLADRGCILVTVSNEESYSDKVNLHINIGDIECLPAWGIPFIFIPQITAYKKAINTNINPDKPKGLDAVILF